MTNKEILKITEHRPWEMPSDNWKFYQEWNDAVFLHWKVDCELLRNLVPRELEIDLFEGNAWVSLVAFTMENIRPRNLPSFSPISNFHEINIRTYVKLNNKTGVFFLSIEAGKLISCKIAKTLSELPYRLSTIERGNERYTSSNREFSDRLKIKYHKEDHAIEKSALDSWLTERYALFQDHDGSINQFEIHHLEWPIFQLKLNQLEIEYPRFDCFFNRMPDKTHYSPGVKVLAWDKTKIPARTL